ncbi:MAG: glycoside hydrolase family 2 TIM barrel-domain containing protein [Candidatus Omnitrophota bacterium]
MKRLGLVIFLCFFVMAGCGDKGPKKDRISIEQLPNGHYRLLLNKELFIVKGVCYAPVPIGKSHLFNFTCDPNRPWIADGKLMQDMGVNTIRLYQAGDELGTCKEMIEDLYKLYGIRTIMGHSLGFWDYPPPNYGDQQFLDEVTESVISMVMYFKDTPGILIWNLGNENNYSFDGRINPWTTPEIDAMESYRDQTDERARLYYSFVNQLAGKIKQIDKYHPVSLGNGETVGLKIAAQNCPEVDLLGCIVYRGKVFGTFFKEVKRKFDKPVVLTEFGCDAFNAEKQKEDQKNQAKFLKSQWLDIEKNLAGNEGIGNCIGGAVFEWTDEWWKTSESDRDSWLVHDTSAGWGMGAYDFDARAGKNMNEEWFGIVALSEELEDGINKRIPRKAYFELRELWKEPETSYKSQAASHKLKKKDKK